MGFPPNFKLSYRHHLRTYLASSPTVGPTSTTQDQPSSAVCSLYIRHTAHFLLHQVTQAQTHRICVGYCAPTNLSELANCSLGVLPWTVKESSPLPPLFHLCSVWVQASRQGRIQRGWLFSLKSPLISNLSLKSLLFSLLCVPILHPPLPAAEGSRPAISKEEVEGP